ncbi:ABATE domain-containing protein [Streptomyces sp. NPDC005573]|uniref:ABATE domain-containing protein n=1 Tax=Streptomyces sp. NPDC005573 TaxID=3156890 RepID=UPI0033A0A09C
MSEEKGRPLPPAPGSAEHAGIALANTWQVFSGGTRDLLADRERASSWLAENGLIGQGAALGDPCTARLRTLRHHVRRLLSATAGASEPPEDSITEVNAAIKAAPSATLIAWDRERGLHRVVTHPVDELTDSLLAALAADTAELLCGPDASRIAACAAAPCSRFYLRTHGARQWCSVRCGDRIRAARAYRRKNSA